jgi:hypothetical protein
MDRALERPDGPEHERRFLDLETESMRRMKHILAGDAAAARAVDNASRRGVADDAVFVPEDWAVALCAGQW